MSWRESLLRLRASRVGEVLIGLTDFDLPWRVRNVRFPVYLQVSKNLSELLTGSGKEAAERKLFRSIAAHPEIMEFWDVGANIGQYTWEFISSGSDKRVMLFEPDERNARTIRKTIARGTLASCDIRKEAVSNTVGTLHFKRDTITGKQGTVVADANIERIMGRPASSVQIPCTTIDQVRRETNRSPDILKIDVEGAEQAVIDGAAETLRTDKPIVFMEVLPNNFLPIEQALASKGYRLFDAVSIRPAHKDSFNLVAVNPDRHQSILDSLLSSQ